MKIFSVLLVCLSLLPTARAGMEDMPPSNRNAPHESLVPTHITGIVTPLAEASYCMDGATHSIQTKDGNIRLKGRSPEAAQQLAYAASTKQPASVMGYPVTGPECSYLSVYSVSVPVSAGSQPESK